jgi:Kef-type K+ transport system membrane component KefB
LIASIWIALALVASMISIRFGLSVALAEILVGLIGGNAFGLHTTPWIDFLASFGAILLTFLAGAEIDPASFRQNLKSSLAIGAVGFIAPFLGVWLLAYYAIGWDMRPALIAGIALSTTSVAVVYAVMVETGLNETKLGKLILSACFVNDLGTVLALGIFFANFDIWMVVFIAALVPALWLLPRVAPWVISRCGNRVSEPEVKFFLLLLFVLAWLATAAGSEAVLPAYLIGLVAAGTFIRDRAVLHRMRTIAFAALTPFYFIKAGIFVSAPALITGFVLIVVFLAMKMVTKFIGVWPVTRFFRMPPREGNYTTLLMSTGLTFGSISALFGLTHGIIDQSQYTILVTVVIGSAVVPTLIAQKWFYPRQVKSEAQPVSDISTTGSESTVPVEIPITNRALDDEDPPSDNGNKEVGEKEE